MQEKDQMKSMPGSKELPFYLDDKAGSREKILFTIKQNQPDWIDLPVLENYVQPMADTVEKFKTVLQAVGGQGYEVNNISEIITVLKHQYNPGQRIISVMNEFSIYAEIYGKHDDPHKLNDVEVAIIKAQFGVAENGAIWVTEDILHERVLPFICQHLVAVVSSDNIVATMHDAYDQIGNTEYGFGSFIAGPSKTADIEQSLVLGAHGPKTMTVFIVNNKSPE